MAHGEVLTATISALEAKARALVADAARSGDFEAVTALTPLATDIAALASRWCRSDGRKDRLPRPEEDADVAVEIERGVSAKSKDRYPYYLRDGDDLVKVGWSARDGAPYEHRASRQAVDRIASAIAAKGKAGRRFQMAALIDAIASSKPDDGPPSYQVYVTVSWLKWHGLLLQHGRQGYTIVRPQTFVGSVETAWQALTKR